ncbi:MAG: Ig-like domain-containing protein, partial [Candidatus Latescibacteria bacterium]|nr:Ig-like domain-containing protein [Candidatus Latescibacterota bacterium]
MNTRRSIRVAALAAFLAAGVAALTTAGPGTGTANISPSSSVAAGSSGEWSITYTAAELHDDGTLRVTIPTGWTAPQDGSATSPGFVTVATNEPTGAPGLSVAGQVITVVVDTLNAGNTITIVYGSDDVSSSGRATAATTVGTYPFLVESDPTGGSPAPIVTSPDLDVIADAPASLEIVPGDSLGVVAGSFVELHIRVLDAFGNRTPVPSNRTVNLFATHGQYYDPSNHSTPITSAVIASGTNVKRVDYRPTLTGGSPHTLNMITQGGSPTLGGSGFVGVVPAPVSAAQSLITATTPVVADGVAQSTVKVTSRDAFGNRRPGDTVTIDATGSAVDTDPPSPTDAIGEASGVVTNIVAEPVTVSAVIAGTPITATAPISFVAGPPSGATSIVDATTGVVANGIATSTIMVTVRDANNNPVSGQQVNLAVNPVTNATLSQPGGVTDALGQVTGTLSSTTAIQRTVTATFGALPGTPITDNAVVQFVAGPLANFLVTVDGNAVAGADDPVIITARDAQGNTVTNYTGTVNLTTTSGETNSVEWSQGDGQGSISNIPGSNNGTYTFALADLGVAAIRVRNNKVETFQAAAQAGAASGTSGNLVVTNAGADKIELVSGDAQSAVVNTPVGSPPTVRVVDAFNNPVPGATVTFTPVGGGGFVDVSAGGGTDSTGTTLADGRIGCDVWRLGTIAGLNRLRARIASGSITSVDFTATGTPGQGTSIVITPVSKSVTVNSTEVVTATLRDQFNNLKPGERVDILIKADGDSPDGTMLANGADPNPTTFIGPTSRYGTTDANGRITVIYQAPNSAGVSDSLDAFTVNVGQGSVTDAVYTTTASGATNLRITFVGPSTRPADQTFQFLVEAIDGNDNVDPTNTSLVTLTPEVGGGLTFSETDFGPTVTQITLVNGAKTVYGRGTFAGDWDITTTGGGLGDDTEIVTITDTGEIDHYAVSTVPSVIAGVVFDVTVEAQDIHNNRVMGATNAVTLEAFDDVANNPAQALLLDPSATLVAGRVTVAETYTKAEAIRVRASASGDEGFSGVVNVSAAAAHRIAKISGDAAGIIAGANQALVAQVLDQYDNPVNNALVTFTVLDGGGSPSPPTDNTDATGHASTTLTTGTIVDDNRIKATIGDENPPSLERVEFLVSTIPGPVASFQVTPASFSLVAGAGVALNVAGFDANSNPVTNDDATPIQLTETGSAQFGAATGILTSGQFNTTVVDTVAESFTITAQRQGGGASGTSGTLTVSHAGAYRITKVSGDASGVTVGGAQPLEVLVRDPYDNPVPNALVTFATTGAINDGSFTDTSGDPNDGIAQTDALGHALVTFTTSLTAGANNVNAQILDGAPVGLERVTFTVNTVAGGIAYYTVQMNGTTVTAGQTRNVTVTAFDASDNQVDDDVTQVDLSGDPGNALVFGIDPVTLTNGAATTTVRADQVQVYQVRARTVGLPAITGLGEAVTVNPAAPAGTITATPSPATITANGISISTITSGVIRDAFSNQVATGTMVNVNSPPPTNGGVIVGPVARAVAADGTISFDLRSSTTPGVSTVTMASQTGTATGTVNVTFAPRPTFTAAAATPAIVAPAQSVAFSVQVNNTSTTDANLTTATTFTFTDGTRVYSANLAAGTSILGGGAQVLVFNAATVLAAFTPGPYTPNVVLVGADEFGAPINTTVATPAQSLLVTSIQIMDIDAPSVVSRGQSHTVTVSVRNNGTQPTNITDIFLVFAPGGGLFAPDPIVPTVVDPAATEQFAIMVAIDPSCPVGDYSIDANVVGNIGGVTVTDNSLAPFPLPTWEVVTAANLSYVTSSLSPMAVSRGAPYQFRATIANGGAGIVSLDSASTYMQFTDGTLYEAHPTQPYAIAGASQQQIVFKTRVVASAFTAGSYGVTFNLEGTEGAAPFQQTVTSGADQVAVQNPAGVVSGSVLPDQVSKGSSVAFTVQVTNSGGATVVLTPATTEFRFAGGDFTADLSPSGNTTIPPGSTTLAFLSTTVSQGIAANSYPGQLALNGFENGNPFSSTMATEVVVVEDAPNVQILSNAASQSPITADQTKPFKVRMVVRNNGGADVTFTDASIRFIQAGQDRSGQFVISTPTGFVLGGTTLAGGETDTVTFDISDNLGNAMTAPAMMTIEGSLEVEDVNTQQPILAELELGNFLQVQTQAGISVVAVLPSQSTVTQSMDRDFLVRAVVRNTGTSDMTLDLTQPATDVTFTPPAGWIATPRSQLGNGGNVLSGSEVDTVLFDVTTSGSTTGTALINTNYTGTEINSGRAVTGGSSGSASIDVQSPGQIAVTSVVASRATITSGAGVPWTLTVTLENTGQSDVDLDLGNAIAVSFQNVVVPPGLTRPSILAGGGTVLSGGEIDQIVIGVAGSGTYSTPGIKDVGVTFDGIEINSNEPVSGINATTVTVQLQPSLNVVSVSPATVSRGSIVSFQVTIENATTNGATAALNPLTTRLIFGSNAYNVNLDASSPVDIAANQQITLLFNAAQVVSAIPLGNQNDAVLQFRFVENDTPRSENEPMNTPPKLINVQAAPALNITSVRASRQNVTTGQTAPAWHITMVLTNANGSDVDLDLSGAVTYLRLNLLGSGANVTPEYTITQPTALFGGGEILSSGETDSLIFDVAEAGTTPGNVIISGFVGGIDVVSTLPVSDNTGDGGSGSFVLQTPAVLNVLSITPERPTATAGQTGAAAEYTMKMAVRNDGQAAVDLDLSPPTATAVAFTAPTGWITALQPALVGGGVRLSGGETDTVVFNVTTTGTTAAVQTIGGTIAGIELNRGVTVTDNTTSGGTGSITVQTPAQLDILAADPSRTNLTSGASTPWDILVEVRNLGESAVRLVLPAGLAVTVDGASPPAVFDPVNGLEEGGVVLAGLATGTLLVHADGSPTFTAFGTRNIGVLIDAVELNSSRALNGNEPAAGSVVAQTPPNLTVALVSNPTLVTQGTQAFLELDVTNPGADAATVDLDAGNTRVSFAGGQYSAVLQPVSPTQIGPGQTVRVSFEDKLVEDTIAAGSHNLAVDLAYTANGLDVTENETVANGITVQVPAVFRITGIAASQTSATAGQTTPWTATMSIVNEGSTPIDLSLAAGDTYIQFVVPGGGFDPGYTVVQPTELVGGGTQLGVGLSGQLEFTVTQTGNTTGVIVISGRVEGTDAGSATVFDDTFDGGRGSIAVVPASAVSVLATHTSQPRVTAGQTAVWGVRVLVRNAGGASVNVDLATSNITFDGGAGWVVTTPPVFGGGGNPLQGGEVDSLLFEVAATATDPGTWRIDASIPWQDVTTQATGTANTNTSGFGSIVVQTPVAIRVATTVSQSPNPGEVNVGQAFAIRVQVENTGQADARDVQLEMTSDGASTVTPLSPITEIAGGQTATVDFAIDAANVPNPNETFSSAITTATDENSGAGVAAEPPVDNTAIVAVQNPAVYDITSVQPSQPTVTRGQTIPWNLTVRVRNTGQSDAVLAAPAANDLLFEIGGSTKTDYVAQPPTAFASGTSGWTLAGGAVDSLIYAVNVTGADTGLVDVTVTSDGSDRNDPSVPFSDNGVTTVRVQQPAGFAIASTVPIGTVNQASADRDTVNTGFGYEIHVNVDNTGEAVDSVLVLLTSDLSPDQRSLIAPQSLQRQQIDVDGDHTFIFVITAPANPVVLETFTAAIQPGARSRNTGQIVLPQPALDNRHVVVTQRPADLVLNLTSASPTVSTNQVFTMSATVTNAGQAGVSGPAELTLALPANFVLVDSIAEPRVRSFAVGSPVSWQVRAPGTAPGSGDFTCAITDVPEDVNTGAEALASQSSDLFAVNVVSGGAFTSPTVAIPSPAGAQDGTVSAAQDLTLRAEVTSTPTTTNVAGTLTAPGFTVLGTPTLVNLPGNVKRIDFDLRAPANASVDDLFVTFTGIDQNTQQAVPTAADTIAVTTVPRTA